MGLLLDRRHGSGYGGVRSGFGVRTIEGVNKRRLFSCLDMMGGIQRGGRQWRMWYTRGGSGQACCRWLSQS